MWNYIHNFTLKINSSDRFELLYEKLYVKIGWFTESNILKVTFLKDYSLYEATDITIELAGAIISKQVSKLLLEISTPLNLSNEVKHYTIKETFPLFEVYGLKKIAYIHFEGEAYEALAGKSISPLSKIKVKVFEKESEAHAWLLV